MAGVTSPPPVLPLPKFHEQVKEHIKVDPSNIDGSFRFWVTVDVSAWAV